MTYKFYYKLNVEQEDNTKIIFFITIEKNL